MKNPTMKGEAITPGQEYHIFETTDQIMKRLIALTLFSALACGLVTTEACTTLIILLVL